MGGASEGEPEAVGSHFSARRKLVGQYNHLTGGVGGRERCLRSLLVEASQYSESALARLRWYHQRSAPRLPSYLGRQGRKNSPRLDLLRRYLLSAAAH